MSLKFITFILLLATSQTINAQGSTSDWEVINLAFDNILAANPVALADAFLNIASGILPSNIVNRPTPPPTITAR